MERKRTEYTFSTERIKRTTRFAVAPDIHSSDCSDVMDDFARCDAVLVPGDLMDRHRRNNEYAYRFLKEVPSLVPVFLSLGNHEIRYRHADRFLKEAERSDVILLRNRWVEFRGIFIGGLSSAMKRPDLAFLDRFEELDGYRLLLCHHPEFWRDYVRGRNIDLTLCGHAHGGQIQIGGRGLYAPGQGLFPKLTDGLYGGGKMLLSRGMTNAAKPRIPRIGNPTELIILTLEKKEKTEGKLP